MSTVNNWEENDENSHQMGAFGITRLAMESVRAFRPQMTDPISWMGSPPGGPLAEALCLGIASSQSTSTSSYSKSTWDDGQWLTIINLQIRDLMCLNCKCTILSSSIKDYRSHRDVNSKQVLENN